MIRVATLDELRERGVMVVTAADRPVAVFYHDGQVHAVDNRCPHMGFPLHQGTVKDGLVICHWHEARFALSPGCTFDLWADDVPSYETEIRDGTVFVASAPRHPEDAAHFERRLKHGLEHSIPLVQAKAILGLRSQGVDWSDILRTVALFGARHHDMAREGMITLTVIGNLLPYLSEETAYFAMLRASRQVAIDCEGAETHRDRDPLEPGEYSAAHLSDWLTLSVMGRQRDAAERVLLAAIDQLGEGAELTDLICRAASERVYADTGHVFDFHNKAWELAGLIGWQHAPALFPLMTAQLVAARGAEENAHWHQPAEIIEPLREIDGRLPELLAGPRDPQWQPAEGWVDVLLGDDPQRILDRLEEALKAGAPPAELTRRIAWAAAVRLARFAMSNEVADWFNPRHTFIFANAVHQAVLRSPTPRVVRSLLHAAMSVYQDRFLNVPPARLPGESSLQGLPEDAGELLRELLVTLDAQSAVERAAALVTRYLRGGHPPGALIDTLTLATVREDLDFHAVQVLEAGVRQFHEWDAGPEREQILIGVVRQLAAFCPTPRAGLQTARIALRLHRGEQMYE